MLRELSEVLRASIAAGLDNREEALAYALAVRPRPDAELADRFVGMYVNELTAGLRRRGPPGGRGAPAPRRGARRASEARSRSSSSIRRAVADAPRLAAWPRRSSSPPSAPLSGATAARSPGVRPDDLAALAIAAAVERAGVPAGEIEDVYLGCANQAGEDNRNVARMAALLAGLPEEVAGVTVNRLCASGSRAVVGACHAVAAGDGDLFVAGGVESMSRAPLVMAKPERAFPRGDQTVWDTTLGWRFPNPRMEEMFPLESMGETGENVAERWEVSREEQDAFALESQRRWAAADEAGRFADELVPVGGRRARRASAAGHDAREARRAASRRSAKAARSPPATRAASTTAPPRSSSRARSGPRELGAEPLGALRRRARSRASTRA